LLEALNHAPPTPSKAKLRILGIVKYALVLLVTAIFVDCAHTPPPQPFGGTGLNPGAPIATALTEVTPYGTRQVPADRKEKISFNTSVYVAPSVIVEL
jgi:hypothetical protein